MRTLTFILSATALLSACNETKDLSEEQLSGALAPNVEKCNAALTNNFSEDSRSFHFSADEITFGEEVDDDAIKEKHAIEAIAHASELAGCSPNVLSFEITTCSTLSPDFPVSSTICYASTDLGYFTVSLTMPHGIAVTYSRHD